LRTLNWRYRPAGVIGVGVKQWQNPVSTVFTNQLAQRFAMN
jgi:hypothetical protein